MDGLTDRVIPIYPPTQILRGLNICFAKYTYLLPWILYTNIDKTLPNSLHRLLNCAIGGLDCRVITTEYRTRVHCIHMHHFLQCVGPCYLFGSLWSMFVYNTALFTLSEQMREKGKKITRMMTDIPINTQPQHPMSPSASVLSSFPVGQRKKQNLWRYNNWLTKFEYALFF